jgi:hypothetical protein
MFKYFFRARYTFAFAFLVFFVAGGTATPFHPPSVPKDQATVWAISTSKVYHCPGSRWYGKTPEGKYISECQAVREGFRPAFGRGCGSECVHGLEGGQPRHVR